MTVRMSPVGTDEVVQIVLLLDVSDAYGLRPRRSRRRLRLGATRPVHRVRDQSLGHVSVGPIARRVRDHCVA